MRSTHLAVVPLLALGLAAAPSCAPSGDYGNLPTEPICRAFFVDLREKGLQTPLRTQSVKIRQPQVTEPGAVFRMLDPIGPSSWARESLHSIMWDPGNAAADAKVRVEQSADGGASWSEIQTVPAAQARIVWTVPADGADRRLVRVVPSWVGGGHFTFDLTLTPSQKASYQWVCITDQTPFHQRDGAGALVYHDRMWLIGGWNPDPYFPKGATGNDVWSSVDGREWRMDKPQTFKDGEFDPVNDWEGRHTGGYAVFADKMWIIGGDPLQGHYQRDAWSSTDGRVWKLETDSMPWADRALHYTLVFQDRIWVLGGQTMTDFISSRVKPYKIFNDVWSSPNGVDWTQVATKGPMWQPRATIQQSAVLDGKMWVIAGGTYESKNAGVYERQFMMDVWSSPDGVSWTQVAVTTPWSPRQYQSLAAWDGKLWVISGYDHDGNVDGGYYSSDGKNWYATVTPWDPRHATSLWVYKDAIWISGGGNVDVWRLERAPR